MKLSPNLTLREAIKSATAIRHGLTNWPTDEHIENLKVTANEVFQPVRDHFNVPIGISSGYRSKELNRLIGGSLTSQHSVGQALDLDADIFGGVTNAEIFYFIKDNIDFDQLIWEFGDEHEPAWVHVSYHSADDNRNQILIAEKVNGKTKYRNW
jgi:zinc D-Ala-D-Ala carboxypeptidase